MNTAYNVKGTQPPYTLATEKSYLKETNIKREVIIYHNFREVRGRRYCMKQEDAAKRKKAG